MFKIGEQVVCVNDVFDPRSIELIPNRPKKDKLYTIRDILYYELLDKTGVLLGEIKNGSNVYNKLYKTYVEPTFGIHRFAPVNKTTRHEGIEEEEFEELEQFL